MSLESITEALIARADHVRAGLVAAVRRVDGDECDWSPDTGIASARDLVSAVIGEEIRQFDRLAVALGSPSRTPRVVIPQDATPRRLGEALRASRSAHLVWFRAALAAVSAPASASAEELVAECFLDRIEADARALGELGLLQRLIDPSRV